VIDRRGFLSATALALLGACHRRPTSSSTSLSNSTLCLPLPRRTIVPLHPDTLARFVDALPIPKVLEPDGFRADPTDATTQIPYYRVAMRTADVSVHRDLPPTRMWSYGGSVPGPTIETRSGRGALIEWSNELPAKHFLPIDHTLCGTGAEVPEVRTVVHVHGSRVPPESDGHPDSWFTPGAAKISHYPNQQDAATLWYHDHAMGIERLNQYAGLFGMYLVRDDGEDALHLPRGAYEIPLVLCDRLFDSSAQLVYPTSGMPEAPWVSEVQGDALLVNAKLFPFLEVEPRRYRFRVVNASNSRFYYLSLSNGQAFDQIGSDQGLLPSPVASKSVTLAPAERADLVIDFSGLAGQDIVLHNHAFELMQFRVRVPAEANASAALAAKLPTKLRTIERLAPASATKTRLLTLNEYEDPKTHMMLMMLNGTRWREPVTENPRLGSTEIWSFVNLTEDTHPIHLHLVRFQVLDRQLFDADEYLTSGAMNLVGKPVPPEANEMGWKDTVRAAPGMITRIIAKFDGYAGRYVWHCHVLEHAANEMMRPFEVVA
jgi:spore coat protein A